MPLLTVTEDQILSRIKFENPWWKGGRIDPYFSEFRRRLYFDQFYQLITEVTIKRAVVLMGPRRVGKTVMIYHAIQQLIDKGTDPQKIIYLSIETPIYNGLGIEGLFRLCRQIIAKEDDLSGYYIFFDEIQYLKDWELHLKSLVDSYHRCKFIVSGSAAAALKLKSDESGAGRFTDFTLPPLTFHEYVHLQELDHLIICREQEDDNVCAAYDTIDITELNRHFVQYINYGGYPEISLSVAVRANPGRYIKSDIIDKVLLRDLPSLYGIQDVQELNSLFTTIAYNSGNEFTYESLSMTSGVSSNTIKKYIHYLQAAFLIKVVHRIDQTGKKFKRANYFKIYLTNPSLRSALFAPIEATADLMGNMVETAIYAQWFHDTKDTPNYSRWRSGEVDVVRLHAGKLKPEMATEIKWTNKYHAQPRALKSLRRFLMYNNLPRATVTTIDITDRIVLDEHTLQYTPAAIYCYTQGRQIHDQQ